MNKLMALALMFLLSGCATTTSQGMNRLSIGMTKDQVTKAMGQPTSTAAQNGAEIFKYNLYKGLNPLFYDDTTPPRDYFVRFIDGKTESFGEMGDFDSTKDPTINVNLNQRVQKNSKDES